jgi:hypothetical protein
MKSSSVIKILKQLEPTLIDYYENRYLKYLSKDDKESKRYPEFRNGCSLGYTTKWNSLAGETTTQQQSQSQAQGSSNVRFDGSHNNVVIEPRQSQEESSSSSEAIKCKKL